MDRLHMGRHRIHNVSGLGSGRSSCLRHVRLDTCRAGKHHSCSRVLSHNLGHASRDHNRHGHVDRLGMLGRRGLHCNNNTVDSARNGRIHYSACQRRSDLRGSGENLTGSRRSSSIGLRLVRHHGSIHSDSRRSPSGCGLAASGIACCGLAASGSI